MRFPIVEAPGALYYALFIFSRLHVMEEQRRHQRIRFGSPPAIKIGFAGSTLRGTVENLSLSGIMLRTPQVLEIGKTFGCEFSVFGSPKIDIAAITISKLGDLFGARFQAGPISDLLIRDAMDTALASGQASVVSMHRQQGRRIMRIIGGLNATLANDFFFSLTKVGVDEIDVGEVSQVDEAGLNLCLNAVARHSAKIGAQSECFASAWAKLEQRLGAIRAEA